MNENATALYTKLKNSEFENFDMGWPDDCIAGHARRMSEMVGQSINNRTLFLWLGLTDEVALALIFPKGIGVGHPLYVHEIWGHVGRNIHKATQPQAAEALRKACELSEAQP